MTWRFDIPGVPAPQGSKTAIARGGRAYVIEGGSTTGRRKHRAWRDSVAWATRGAVLDAGGQTIDDDTPITVTLRFRFARPASRRSRGELWHAVKPDIDKLCRSTLDGLAEGGLFPHDQRVSMLSASKRYCRDGEDPGCDVWVDVLNPGEVA